MAKPSIIQRSMDVISSIFKKPSIWVKLMFLIIFALLIVSLFKKNTELEGFVDTQEIFEYKTGEEIYDDFYANIYDLLVFNQAKNEFEIGKIVNSMKPDQESHILDIGSGTGHHVDTLHKMGHVVTGLDNSSSMIQYAQNTFPENKYILGDAMNALIFQPNSFTQIMCLYFTLYYIQDKRQFFGNCFNWLIPGGSLIIHVVDPAMFDPIIPPANPLLMLTPQRYADKRITYSKVTFDDFKYVSNFEMDDDKGAKFVERFQNKETGKTFRKNEHKLYMESEDDILTMAKETGFIVHGKIDMIKSGYEYNYLYILQKPE